MFAIFISRRKEFTVTFEVVANPEKDIPAIYITGNHPLLGNWDPAAIALKRDADGVWRGKFTFKKNTDIEYKLTRGSWQSEALNDSGKTFNNQHFKVHKDEVLRITVPRWKNEASPEDKKAGDPTINPETRITGAVKFHRQFQMVGLLPRDVIVWLPPGYETEEEKRYPALYMHDGQNIFDPLTAYTGVDWEADETATRLIKEGKMQEIIIVGVYNTEERLEEYSLTPQGRLYMDFLCNTLKPFIDKQYRTKPEREHTATMGSSMGGLISFLLVWYHSRVFSKAGCLSPSFIYNKSQAIKDFKKSRPPAENIRIYMDCGGVGGERWLYHGCKRMIRLLRKKGIKPGKYFRFYYDKDANHSEQAWGKRLWRPFLFLFAPDKKG